MDASAIGDIIAIAEKIPGYSYRQTIMKQAREVRNSSSACESAIPR
ncbi:hypothetical protein [Paraburkholderia dipogonis]